MHNGLYFGFPRSHELRYIPFATCSAMVGENGEEGIALGKRFPIVLKPLEIHHEFLNSHHGTTGRRATAVNHRLRPQSVP